MAHDVKCKRIIDGRTYNTETATLLGIWDGGKSSVGERLFKTRHGAYFLHIALLNEPSEQIKPLNTEAAQEWLEQHCSADSYEAEFGPSLEVGDPESRFTVRMPDTLHKRIASIAAKRKQSLNAWIVKCLEHSVLSKSEANPE